MRSKDEAKTAPLPNPFMRQMLGLDSENQEHRSVQFLAERGKKIVRSAPLPGISDAEKRESS